MQQIITSLLDTDFYKYTMGYLAWSRYADVPVEYQFINRTHGVDVGAVLNLRELREQLEAVRSLRLNLSELSYLQGMRIGQKQMFSAGYIDFLQSLQLPPFSLSNVPDGHGSSFSLRFCGKWPEVIFWETIALSIINEMYFDAQLRDRSAFARKAVEAQGVLNLADKIRQLKQRPDVTFIEFGTRRRANKAHQRFVVEALKDELPAAQFRGTSNVKLAFDLGLVPMGTNGHEGPMVLAGIYGETDEGLRQSQGIFLDDWWDLFGPALAIGLTDTYGSDVFFSDASECVARSWRGMRQDSGDPFVWTEKALAFYKKWGVDPYNADPAKAKLLLYSDGLELPLIFKIADYVKGKALPTFGWGTNLTNDLGVAPLSIVVKVNKAAGRYVAKLSDNLDKATGRAEAIARTKRVFGYTNEERVEVKY